jgi:transcriptional regulator with XRE-family HTH domain
VKYGELRGQIRAKFKTQKAFADAMGMSLCSLCQKLNGKTQWKAEEIRKACELLDIAPIQIPRYFFCTNC